MNYVERRLKFMEMKQSKEFKDNLNIYILVLLIMLAAWAFIYCPTAKGAEMDLSKAVIHHTASHDVSAKTIDQWHKERGWDGIGYHFVIRADGTIEEGRNINKRGAHAKGRNHYLGIVLTGYDIFTKEQIEALKLLLSQLGIKTVEGHHENCPGKGINLNNLIK